jgi:hypothetical protein
VEKKKALRWAATAGVIVFVSALVTLVSINMYKASQYRQWSREAEERTARLRKEYQAYVDDTAQKIQGLPADPRIIGDVQARHYRALPATWLYVWAATNDGEFSFGVPSDAFARLNAAYNFHRNLITQDNHYASRDQFLRTLLHNERAIPLRARDEGEGDERRRRDWNDEIDWWRFRREETDPRHTGGRTIAFVSSPIQDAAGKTVGNLNLKLIDVESQRSHDRVWHDADELFGVAMFFSFFWLWFLLPSWVYIDAREREVPRPLLWAFLTLVGNVFALVVYLISRPAAPAPKELLCPKCQRALNGAKAGCPYCGADLSSAFCQQCQYPLKSEWSFCPACRTPAGKAPALTPEMAK